MIWSQSVFRASNEPTNQSPEYGWLLAFSEGKKRACKLATSILSNALFYLSSSVSRNLNNQYFLFFCFVLFAEKGKEKSSKTRASCCAQVMSTCLENLRSKEPLKIHVPLANVVLHAMAHPFQSDFALKNAANSKKLSLSIPRGQVTRTRVAPVTQHHSKPVIAAA
ncbi:hypothetical protein BDY21DRAFT_349167 [Lineolata rhizophorae]|uniref:Uncharacterized protein n=1 Tax=Lineolata rhizophorae TaxID=578093 RepID=A0A6A6NW46_9PEZI|nr:hypothetical protein BDY21DRAFT_349167 [Lineolata rhizophorae]